MVNQLELHPQYVQRDAVNYCKDHRMIVEAWSPLIKGQLSHPLLVATAGKYNKTVAQLLLHWSIQNGFLPLPKSSTKERMLENTDIFDFEITPEDMEAMKTLEVFGLTGPHPDSAPF
jgi:diketogulonate reductase-like aldo/keto reductase